MAEPQSQSDDGTDAAQDALRLERILRGDAEAYGELVSAHMRRAFSIAWRILEHREDAEDVVQDAFLQALQRLDTLDAERGFGPWFHRIVVNRALNLRRGRSVRATEPLPHDVVAGTQAPDAAAEQASLRTRLHAAVSALPERQRVIVQLADLEGFNSSEIADMLDVSAGTVRWHLHQARQTLRDVLESEREDR
jgi:RNA polymerase sigma-70 factor, ECF subfamily